MSLLLCETLKCSSYTCYHWAVTRRNSRIYSTSTLAPKFADLTPVDYNVWRVLEEKMRANWNILFILVLSNALCLHEANNLVSWTVDIMKCSKHCRPGPDPACFVAAVWPNEKMMQTCTLHRWDLPHLQSETIWNVKKILRTYVWACHTLHIYMVNC